MSVQPHHKEQFENSSDEELRKIVKSYGIDRPEGAYCSMLLQQRSQDRMEEYLKTLTRPYQLHPLGSMDESQSEMTTKETELDIFISHSGQDQQIASVLIDLLRTAMDIPPRRIRCTSVDGYRLPGGASTEDQLKREVRETKCFIALLTLKSIKSTYVLFELGARWGAKLPFIPLLAAGLNASELEGPVSGLNALSCASHSQLHQLITDIHGIIRGANNEPSAYDAKLQALRSLSEEAATLGDPEAKADKESPQLKKTNFLMLPRKFWS